MIITDRHIKRFLSLLLAFLVTFSISSMDVTEDVYAEEFLPLEEQTELIDENLEEKNYNSFQAIKLNLQPAEREEMYEADAELYDEIQIGKAYPDPDSNMGIIYKYITEEMGLNRAVAFGILAHMKRESTFLPTAYNPSGYYGLCQWGGNRYTNLISWCTENGYDYTTIEGQVRFMNSELNGPYSKVLDTLKECENTAEGAYEAAYAFGMRYEVSGIALAKSAGSAAMSMFNHVA
ncbi:MAG: hypothetical protein IJ091_10530 [Oscillospiraceae bacterium]|nr:hypothetical protein [Oscillospiraceae bacterium]